MTQRIILFNGPPRSGKDTAARFLFDTDWMKDNYFVVFDRMSMPVKKAFAGMVAAPIDSRGNVAYHEDHKAELIGILGISYRQWQIDFSERFMKPLYGEAIFANLFIDRQRRQHKDAVILVPDCGFVVEYKTLVNHFGKQNVLLVEVIRPGFDFTGDSRSYLTSVGVPIESCVRARNDGTQEDFETRILQVVKEWLNAA